MGSGAIAYAENMHTFFRNKTLLAASLYVRCSLVWKKLTSVGCVMYSNHAIYTTLIWESLQPKKNQLDLQKMYNQK